MMDSARISDDVRKRKFQIQFLDEEECNFFMKWLNFATL